MEALILPLRAAERFLPGQVGYVTRLGVRRIGLDAERPPAELYVRAHEKVEVGQVGRFEELRAKAG